MQKHALIFEDASVAVQKLGPRSKMDTVRAGCRTRSGDTGEIAHVPLPFLQLLMHQSPMKESKHGVVLNYYRLGTDSSMDVGRPRLYPSCTVLYAVPLLRSTTAVSTCHCDQRVEFSQQQYACRAVRLPFFSQPVPSECGLARKNNLAGPYGLSEYHRPSSVFLVQTPFHPLE